MQTALLQSGPRRFLAPELARFGVEVANAHPVRLRCRACDCQWTPAIEADGRMTRRYWLCPRGCNASSG